MTPIMVAVVFSVISSLFFLSQARHGLDDLSSAAVAVTVREPPEDTDRKAIAVPLEEPPSSDESIPADEGFQHLVDLSLRHPIDLFLRHPIDLFLRRPIDRQSLPREITHGSDRIGLPSDLPGEMRSIETREAPETQDEFGVSEEATTKVLTEANAKEIERIPVEWTAAEEEEEEEEEHRRKKKKRDHKKKKEKESDSDSDSDSDDEDEEMSEIEKKKKKKCRKGGGWLKRLWAFLNRF